MTFWTCTAASAYLSYSTSTSLPRDFRARSNVINFKPVTAVKANMYASAQTFGERLGIRERARNSISISSGSGTKTTRSSAQIRSHRLQASAIDLVALGSWFSQFGPAGLCGEPPRHRALVWLPHTSSRRQELHL